MGGATENSEKVAEQLQNLEVKNGSEKDYVYVTDKKSSMDANRSETVSVGATEQWEKDLMQDPKVRPHAPYPSLYGHGDRTYTQRWQNPVDLHIRAFTPRQVTTHELFPAC